LVLIAEKLFKLIARGIFPRIGRSGSNEGTPDHLEILAKIGGFFFCDWISTPIPTLIRDLGIVTDAVQANFQIVAATMTGIASAWLHAQRPFPTTFPAVTCHYLMLHFRVSTEKSCVPTRHDR
jgi:hypothetical protein